ncbi:hypothetical protein B0H13DRAFT_2357660 [Mycena leptocephala]|nr:hypothetical protein B0H13DRAFT_2357660 [Mycena leptocephala]
MSSAGPLSTQVTVFSPIEATVVRWPTVSHVGWRSVSQATVLLWLHHHRPDLVIPEPRLLDGRPVTAHECSEFTLPHCSPSRVPHYLPLAESWTEAHKLQDLFVVQYPRSPAHPDRAARSSQFLRDTCRLIGQLACAHAIYLRRVAMIDQKADVDAIVAEAVASLSTDEYLAAWLDPLPMLFTWSTGTWGSIPTPPSDTHSDEDDAAIPDGGGYNGWGNTTGWGNIGGWGNGGGWDNPRRRCRQSRCPPRGVRHMGRVAFRPPRRIPTAPRIRRRLPIFRRN